jgi:hypothetical protein
MAGKERGRIIAMAPPLLDNSRLSGERDDVVLPAASPGAAVSCAAIRVSQVQNGV